MVELAVDIADHGTERWLGYLLQVLREYDPDALVTFQVRF